ncbi:hypothetical protein PO181_05660 [Leuconostoc suionicum]|nr:hypothetical protein [Leuconostoc suionicum]MDC2816467.1 hypothetical protein [Leuconostoc suionicum]
MKWLKNKSTMLITMTANINHGINLTIQLANTRILLRIQLLQV